MRFHLKTFGCKTNQYEEQGIREDLLRSGHGEVAEVALAEVVIVNTCTVTGRANATWRNFIAQTRRKNPQARLILTGCAVNILQDKNSDELTKIGATAIFRNEQKNLIGAYLNSQIQHGADGAAPSHDFAFSLTNFAGHTRAFLKIQDGCNNHCAYCIIPQARGVARSRNANEILHEAKTLTKNGYRELVLTGINIGAYRDNVNDLATLCRRLIENAGVQRLRLGSIEPQTISENLLLTLRDYPQICSHLHLPLQSGADEILRLMQRQYTLAQYFSVLERARKTLNNPAITTDLIVGFPYENPQHYAETLQTVQRALFAKTHIFLFSPRAGTIAATMKPNHQQRNDDHRRELTALGEKSANEYAQTLCGYDENVLVEKVNAQTASGYSTRYLRTIFPRASANKNEIVRVKIISAQKSTLIAENYPRHNP